MPRDLFFARTVLIQNPAQAINFKFPAMASPRLVIFLILVVDKPPKIGHAGYPVFQKGQQLWSNHDVKLCAMNGKYLHRKNGLVSSSPWRKEKWAGCIQPMEKRKTGWLHPAHGEKKNGLVTSSPWRKRKTDWLHPAHGAKDHREKETWTGLKCVYLSQSMM